MPTSVPTVLKDETSKEEKGKGGQGGKGGEGAEPVEFKALELQAPRPRVSAIGSDSARLSGSAFCISKLYRFYMSHMNLFIGFRRLSWACSFSRLQT